MADTTATQQAILASARRHFMEHGFKSASLNRIVADAGFTKGAFYGYYASKEERFDALVAQTSEGLAQVMGNITATWTRPSSHSSQSWQTSSSATATTCASSSPAPRAPATRASWSRWWRTTPSASSPCSRGWAWAAWTPTPTACS